MSKSDVLRIPDYLGHIVEAIERIHRYVEDMSEIGFLNDEKTQDAVIRNFEIIGEAARNIERYHATFTAAHAEVPWTLMVAMRNRVAHGYFKMDFELIWNTIHTDLPELHQQVCRLIALYKAKGGYQTRRFRQRFSAHHTLANHNKSIQSFTGLGGFLLCAVGFFGGQNRAAHQNFNSPSSLDRSYRGWTGSYPVICTHEI